MGISENFIRKFILFTEGGCPLAGELLSSTKDHSSLILMLKISISLRWCFGMAETLFK